MVILKNVGWLCLEPHAFQKKCKSCCWVDRFFSELQFLIEENEFSVGGEYHAYVDRVIKNIIKKSILIIFLTET